LAAVFGNNREIVIFLTKSTASSRKELASKRYAQVLFEDLHVLFEDYKISEILIDFALF